VIDIDSSALFSIILQEPDAKKMAHAIDASEVRWISAANYFETAMILQSRLRDEGHKLFDDLIREAQIETVPVAPSHRRTRAQGLPRLRKRQTQSGP
jgi:uncharacterized protein with PIN domain